MKIIKYTEWAVKYKTDRMYLRNESTVYCLPLPEDYNMGVKDILEENTYWVNTFLDEQNAINLMRDLRGD